MEGRHKDDAATDSSGGLRYQKKDALESKGKHGKEAKAQAGSQGQEFLKGSSEMMSVLLRPTKRLLMQVHAAQCCLHHCLAGKGNFMSH